MKRKLFLLAIVICLVLPTASFGFNKIVAFGDSLSDTGNTYAMDATAAPASHYWEGRFSNGPVWVEYLAESLSATLECYAYGGSPSAGLGYGVFPGLDYQVPNFEANSGAGDYGDTLFTVWTGANDFTQGITTDPTVPVDNIITAIIALEELGAEHIVVPNMPDLGRTPRAIAAEPGAPGTIAGMTALAYGFNDYLSARLAGLSSLEGFDAVIYEMDTRSILDDLLGSGLFDETTTGAHQAAEANPEIDIWGIGDYEYLFWDDVHPTTTVHQILADHVLSTVPVPSAVWLLGAGLVFLCRIKRKVS